MLEQLGPSVAIEDVRGVNLLIAELECASDTLVQDVLLRHLAYYFQAGLASPARIQAPYLLDPLVLHHLPLDKGVKGVLELDDNDEVVGLLAVEVVAEIGKVEIHHVDGSK